MPGLGRCFVMQSFDGGPLDDRYEDVFAPAIIDAGLEPYRVDRDPNVTIPIDEIEAGIRNADVCLAEISLDKPNVWYELGFAIAAQKTAVRVGDLVGVCSRLATAPDGRSDCYCWRDVPRGKRSDRTQRHRYTAAGVGILPLLFWDVPTVCCDLLPLKELVARISNLTATFQ